MPDLNPEPQTQASPAQSRPRTILVACMAVSLAGVALVSARYGRQTVGTAVPPAQSSSIPSQTSAAGVVCHGAHYTLTAEIHAGS